MSQPANFPATQWTLHVAASINGDAGARRALEELCRRYAGPVRDLLRWRGLSREDAEDLTQQILAHLSHARIWRNADPGKGRFRDYLRRITDNTCRNWERHRDATRRGGGAPCESLDLFEETGGPPDPAGDDTRRFDREWALAALAAAMARLEKDHAARPGGAARFATLRCFLPGAHAVPTYEDAAAALAIPAINIGKIVARFREDFVKCLRYEVTLTLGPGDDLDQEMAYLRSVLSRDVPQNTGPGSP